MFKVGSDWSEAHTFFLLPSENSFGGVFGPEGGLGKVV
jgi:hypothetical protein